MRATTVADVDAFLALVGPLLCAREAEHNLALGLLGRLRADPRLYGFDPTFVVVEDAGEIVGCLLRTPPHGVVLSRFENLAGVDAAAAEVIDMHPGLPGAVGPAEEAARFADAWSRSTGAPARLAVRQRVHAAAVVLPVPRASGHMREPRPDDVPTVVAWLRGVRGRGSRRRRRTSRTSSSPTAGGRPIPTAPGSSGTTTARSRSPATATRRRAASASAPSTPRRSTAGAGTRRLLSPTSPPIAWPRPRVLLSLHRPREPDLERDLRPDRLRPVADWDQWSFQPLE